MAQIIVRNLDEAVKAALGRRAKQHGRSMEEEARDILRAAVAKGSPNQKKFGTWMAGLFKNVGLNKPIEEHRGQSIKPPPLG